MVISDKLTVPIGLTALRGSGSTPTDGSVAPEICNPLPPCPFPEIVSPDSVALPLNENKITSPCPATAPVPLLVKVLSLIVTLVTVAPPVESPCAPLLAKSLPVMLTPANDPVDGKRTPTLPLLENSESSIITIPVSAEIALRKFTP